MAHRKPPAGEDLDDPWLNPRGLDLQGRQLTQIRGDPELDVYEDD